MISSGLTLGGAQQKWSINKKKRQKMKGCEQGKTNRTKGKETKEGKTLHSKGLGRGEGSSSNSRPAPWGWTVGFVDKKPVPHGMKRTVVAHWAKIRLRGQENVDLCKSGDRVRCPHGGLIPPDFPSHSPKMFVSRVLNTATAGSPTFANQLGVSPDS